MDAGIYGQPFEAVRRPQRRRACPCMIENLPGEFRQFRRSERFHQQKVFAAQPTAPVSKATARPIKVRPPGVPNTATLSGNSCVLQSVSERFPSAVRNNAKL